MAAQEQLTHDERDMLAQLQRNDTMRWSEFSDRTSVSALITRGLVKEVGGARLTLTKLGTAALEDAQAKAGGNGNGNSNGRAPDISESRMATLIDIGAGRKTQLDGKRLPAANVGWLRECGFIRMGNEQWVLTPLGRERLAREGVPVDAAETKRETDDIPAIQQAEVDAAEDVPLDAGDGSPAEPEDYSAEDAGEPAYDGDPCPQCGSQNTERIDVISSDPDVWHCECGGCGAGFEVISGGVLVNEDGLPESFPSVSIETDDPPETTVLVNGVQVTLDMPADMTDEDVRERVIQAIQGALTPTQIAAVAVEGSAPALLTADYFDFAAGDEGIASALVSRAAHDGCDCATPCLHRRVLDELMAISPTARALYDTEAVKDALRARLRDV